MITEKMACLRYQKEEWQLMLRELPKKPRILPLLEPKKSLTRLKMLLIKLRRVPRKLLIKLRNMPKRTRKPQPMEPKSLLTKQRKLPRKLRVMFKKAKTQPQQELRKLVTGSKIFLERRRTNKLDQNH